MNQDLHHTWPEGNGNNQQIIERTPDRVLLIEDNPGDATLVRVMLQTSDLVNCELIHRKTLSEGIAFLEKEHARIEAVLLDLSLPDSRGFVTLEKLLEQFPALNIIVLTGTSDKELGVKAVKAGAQDFLVKGTFDHENDLLAKSLRYSIERSRVLKRLEETQQIAQIGSWECLPDKNTFTASAQVYKAMGLDPSHRPVPLTEMADTGHPLHRFYKWYQETIREKSIIRDEEIRDARGEYHFIHLRARLSTNSDGVLMVQGILQDITERKRAEEELTKSQMRYQQIFTQSKDAILIAHYDGKLVDFNQALTHLTEFSKEELAAMDSYHHLLRPEESVNELLLKIKAGIGVKDFPIKVGTKNNEVRECIVTANTISEPDFEGYNCIIRDITEQVNAERLRKARDLARQSEKMKEQFIASVSHEMRTPMNAILGMSNILIQTPLNEEQYDLVKSIKQSSEILLGIVNDILEISAIQNGKITFEHDTFDLYDLLDNLVNVMQYKAQEKDLFFEVHIDPSVPRLIVGDKLRLNQILYNLVGNAIKFTDDGFVKIYVEKLHDIGDDSVQLKFTVEDSGIGIPEDKLDAIFDTFTRVRTKDRLYEGTGLGLSICKNLVEQQGGKIGVESQLGVGSKFFFDLIFEIGKEKTEAEVDPPIDDVNFDPDTPFRLLLVEDHKMNQLVATKTLERKFPHIELVLAENGKQAIERLEKEDFDIILMDIQMPVMDGYEATAWIRKNLPPPKCDTPILAMTAHAYISKDEKFREHGMNDYVLKPFDPEDLFFKISKYINKGNRDE